ncbi:rod shape-determining protein MreC [Rossellomorea vietnamensis]|uniref:Cell shape-determining protein MreC n=2 Tax=Rossellomorea TaxID=2837508 RepID=A0A5D4P4M1_9BACI|nr:MULTISPECIES: rod shape-determining protein MreC [Rossellomorea]TYS19622.1 rod shape-determining protein MreC [Rossellomorea vietnamensis]TYS84041.1 rod shape-determining protein MreC [Rossellomorea aquimaris]
MPRFFLNKRLIILLVSIIVLVALIGYSVRERDNISWPEQFVGDIVGFGQSLVSKPVGAVAGFFENVNDLQNTYTENQKLKSRLEELVKLETMVKDLEKDNDELREILGKEENLRDFDPIQATVIARNPGQWEDLLVIDKGKVQGVQSNMAVITAQGLIGKVKSVKQFSSTIELLSNKNPNNRISALIQGEENVIGSIEGYDTERDQLLVKRIPNDMQVEEGSKVITSGLGGVFPKGLPIGEVKEIESDQYGLTQTAYVEPTADLYHLEHVIVVDRSKVSIDLEEPEEAEDEE